MTWFAETYLVITDIIRSYVYNTRYNVVIIEAVSPAVCGVSVISPM